MNRCLFLVFLLLPFAALAQSETCPRVWRSGDSLLTDPAPAIQWLRDGQAIPDANDRWYLPTEAGSYAVEVSSTPSPAYAYRRGYALAGYVFDELHRPIEGASVRKGAFTATSDEKGRFSLWIDDRKPETTAPVVLVVEKDGHWRNASRQYVSAFETTETRIMLHTRRVTNRVDATQGGEMAYQGFTLQLPPNAVQTEDGVIYSGTILLSVEGSTPSNPDFGLRMPGGSFDAIDANGNDVMLYSYGYLSAEMTTEGGEKLELRPEARATLRFYLPWNETHRPDSVPLWHFNTETAIWEQEGWSVRNGSIYEGQVSHFSSWNCDVPEERGTVRGRIIDCNDVPVKGGWVRVGQRDVLSDSLGSYWSFVPRDVFFDIWTQSDTLRGISVPAMEERTLEDLRGLDFSGLAVYNPLTQTLNVYVSGKVPENLRVSIDGGISWTEEREFIGVNTVPYEVKLDGAVCLESLRVVLMGRLEDCRMLSNEELSSTTVYRNWIEALSAQEAVYRLVLQIGDISNNRYLLMNFPCLAVLSLRRNELTAMPENIGIVSNLKFLVANSNQIAAFPESLCNLIHLEHIDFSDNQLSYIPEAIDNLYQLKELFLRGNTLAALPGSIQNLTQLQWLDLNMNQLTSLPANFSNLSELQTLWLYGNQLSRIPEDFGQLSRLRWLDISWNQLTDLPESFSNLTQLSQLSCTGNQLTNLPSSFGNLTQLKSLDINWNQLTDLPASIANLADSLERLDLSNNPIPVERRAAIQAMLPNTTITW